MSLEALFDHRVRLWRPTTTRGALREEIRTYAPMADAPEDFNSYVGRPKAPLADPGPGLAAEGEVWVFMLPETDARERDIVQVLSGPDSPQTLEVNAPVTRPRGHHAKLVCRVWHGSLPEGS